MYSKQLDQLEQSNSKIKFCLIYLMD